MLFHRDLMSPTFLGNENKKKQIEITVSFFSAPAFPEGKKRKERKNEEKRKKAARGARRVSKREREREREREKRRREMRLRRRREDSPVEDVLALPISQVLESQRALVASFGLKDLEVRRFSFSFSHAK